MAYLNKVMLMGNMTKDPELRYTPQGSAVLEFVIASNHKYKDKSSGEQKEEVSFIGCVAWVKTAELINQCCHQGSPAFVEGRLKQESYEDKQGRKQSKTKVWVENIQFLGNKPKEETEELPPEA